MRTTIVATLFALLPLAAHAGAPASAPLDCRFVASASSLAACQVLAMPSVLAATTITGGGGLSFTTACAADNRLMRSDGTTGAQCSGIIVDDSNNLSGVGTIASGAITSTGNSTIGSGDDAVLTVGAITAPVPSPSTSLLFVGDATAGEVPFLSVGESGTVNGFMGWDVDNNSLVIGTWAATNTVRIGAQNVNDGVVVDTSANGYRVGIGQAPTTGVDLATPVIGINDSNVRLEESGTNDLDIYADNALVSRHSSAGVDVTGAVTATSTIKPSSGASGAEGITWFSDNTYVIDFAAFSAGVDQTSAQAFTGVAFGDTCMVGTSADQSATIGDLYVHVTSAGNIKIGASPINTTSTADPASATYTVKCFR